MQAANSDSVKSEKTSAKRCAYILTSITIISRQPKASETLRKIETHEYST